MKSCGQKISTDKQTISYHNVPRLKNIFKVAQYTKNTNYNQIELEVYQICRLLHKYNWKAYGREAMDTNSDHCLMSNILDFNISRMFIIIVI